MAWHGASPAPTDEFIIYLATSPSGKHYVGQTSRLLAVRRTEHKAGSCASTTKGGETHFCRALRLYGFENFTWSVLEEGIREQELADARERFHIARLKSNDRSRGYNLTDGGANGRPNAEARQRMSVAHKGKTHSGAHRKAQSLSEAHPILRDDGRPFLSRAEAAREMGARTDLSKALRGKGGGTCGGFSFQPITLGEYWVALETWNALVASGHIERQPVWTRSRRGYRASAETKAKLSQTRKGRPQSEAHKANERKADGSRLLAISRPIRRSDGVQFPSITSAAQASNIGCREVRTSARGAGSSLKNSPFIFHFVGV